jgi:hypothetical protein
MSYTYEFLLKHIDGERYELTTLDGRKMTSMKATLPELAMTHALAWTSCWHSVRVRFEEEYEQDKKRAGMSDEISRSNSESE